MPEGRLHGAPSAGPDLTTAMKRSHSWGRFPQIGVARVVPIARQSAPLRIDKFDCPMLAFSQSNVVPMHAWTIILKLGFMLKREKHYLLTFMGLIGLYLILTISLALTSQPRPDEGYFANPAFNLVTKGSMGTSVIEPAGSFLIGTKPGVVLSGINERTYWIMPLHILAQAAWYKMVGFSFLSLRMLSTIWGLIALFSWFVMIKALSGNRQVAILASFFIASDYIFVTSASFGRMDMMCAALGFAAMALYLRFRERNLTLAVLGSQTLLAAGGFTHPNAVMAFASVLFLTIYFDRSLLTWWHLVIAVIPYLLGGVGWGIYILQSPADFLAQFGANAKLNRVPGFISPWTALKQEIMVRYLPVFGFDSSSTGLARLKILILLTYAGAVGCTISMSGIRQHKGYLALLGIGAIYFAIQTFFNAKLNFYLVHTMPILAAILAVSIHWCWRHHKVPTWLLILVTFSFMTFQIGWIAYGIVQNHYQKWYIPVVDYLKPTIDTTNLIVGSAEIGIGLGFPNSFVDDVGVGYNSGRKPDIIVISNDYAYAFNHLHANQPWIYQYIIGLLDERYYRVYTNPYYQIYVSLSSH